MIAQPTSTTAGSVEEELVALRSKLDNALSRISNLERRTAPSAARPALFSIDAPAMVLAQQLCAEIFPGPVDIEIASAPDEPEATWYVLTVVASGTAKEIVDNQLRWASQLDHEFPDEAVNIRLSVKPA